MRESAMGLAVAGAKTATGRSDADYCALPPSFGQERFWALDRLQPGNPTWNLPVRFRLRGALEYEPLRDAINEMVQRHEILRTTLQIVNGGLAQVVAPRLRIEIPVMDLRNFREAERLTELDRLSLVEARRGFDLASGPLFRTSLVRLGSDQQVLLVTPHHSMADYWSVGLISNELGALYSACVRRGDSGLPDLALQYGDFAVWQREQSATPRARAELEYWDAALANLPLLDFPSDFPRSQQLTPDANIISLLLPLELGNALTTLARKEGTTFFTATLAAFSCVLSRYTGQSEFGVATQVAGRPNVDLEPLIGLFLNTIVLRMDLSGDPTFRSVMARVNEVTTDAIANQSIRFEQVLKKLRPRDYPVHDNLFRVNFICQRDPVKPLHFSGIELTAVPSKSQGALYDLNVFLVLRNEGWRLACEYNTSLFRTDSINRLLGNYVAVLQRVVVNADLRVSELKISDEQGH